MSLYINLIDHEKASNSADRQTIWKLLRHNSVPEKITNIIHNSYEWMTCRAVHGWQFTEALQVKTGVRQGCPTSPILSLTTTDWAIYSPETKWHRANTLDTAG